ncbi:pyrroloquinoline quinone biosynthesis peptide chaperone PqqD [Piscinibacter sp. XHJ-5]|uniref:pyrroloquinoline quinone biosynthesis peptide chaperone PqqD n=1 Tax=Piscinibacter sp. XHJ-5 TaxID=3037797 RepID=UPI0024530105|nr:pyrroloquinoline quinone biosynthesis peptide chaperone PqqD [Piscinibacter sp. XHJ-5]
MQVVPKLSPMHRLQYEAVQARWVLLYPEGMVRLNSAAGDVLRRIDGARTVQAVVDDLRRAYPDADLRDDVLQFLREAQERGWLVY